MQILKILVFFFICSPTLLNAQQAAIKQLPAQIHCYGNITNEILIPVHLMIADKISSNATLILKNKTIGAVVERIPLASFPNQEFVRISWKGTVLNPLISLKRIDFNEMPAKWAGQVVPNPSFERVMPSGLADSWDMQQEAIRNKAVNISSTQSHIGKKSLQYNVSKMFENNKPIHPVLMLNQWGLPLEAMKGKMMQFRAFIFLERGSGGGFIVRLRQFGAAEKWLSDCGWCALTTSEKGKWHEVSQTIKCGNNGISSIDIHMYREMTVPEDSIFYLDDITITPIEMTVPLLVLEGFSKQILLGSDIKFSTVLTLKHEALSLVNAKLKNGKGLNDVEAYTRQTFTKDDGLITEVFLYDTHGKLILSKTVQQEQDKHKFVFSTQGLNEGRYNILCQVKNKSGQCIYELSKELQIMAADLW